MDVYVRGKGKVKLNQSDFVSKGGEGKIFKQGNLAYKIYDDPKKMIPEAKINELSQIKNDRILKPLELILNKSNKVIGFTALFANKSEPICKFFTNSFRLANNINNDVNLELVESLREIFLSVHSANCLIVDANEFNFLVSEDFKKVYGIDVNSYQTPSFPATAIMPSIRDWLNPSSFNEFTDWYSFGILTCQLFVGIHPFKGKHKDFNRNDIEGKCKKHLSIFNSEVTVPKVTRDFDLIPSKFMDWYIQIFEYGKRIAPPKDGGIISQAQAKIIIIQDTDNFVMDLLHKMDEVISKYRVSRSIEIIKTEKEIHIGSSKYRVSHDVDCVLTPKKLNKILVKIENGRLQLKCVSKTEISSFECNAEEKFVIKDSLFIKNNGLLMEIGFNDMGDKIVPSIISSCNISPLSSHIFENIIFQSLLGEAYVTIPMVFDGFTTAYYVKKIEELNDHKVLDGKYQNHIAVFTTHHNHEYHRVIIKFKEDFSQYVFSSQQIDDFRSVNFTTLDNGVCILISDDGELRIFHNRIDKGDEKIIKDPEINNTMILNNFGNNVRFFSGKKVFEMQMKK